MGRQMSKTTIDGLKVRESSSSKRPVETVRSSSHAIDMMKRPTSTKPVVSRQRQALIDSIDSIKRKNSTNEFLDPVQTFDFDSEYVDNASDFTTGSDWSDLLGDLEQVSIGEKTPKTKERTSTNNFLNSWGEDGQSDFLNQGSDDDIEQPDPPTRAKRPHHKKRHLARNITIAFICLLVIGGGVVYKWGDELISRLTGGKSGLWDAIVSVVSDEVPFAEDQNGHTNVLIFGTEGYNMNGDTAHGTHDGAQLTDSIMVASLDQKTKDVALLSLPRDLKVPMACSVGKINEVFWCNNQDGTNEQAGAEALMKQVGDVLGIKFQYYAHINWASLIDIIDTIGGITVTLDENIADYDYTGAVAQAGVPIQVNGEQALGLARARHGTQGGDFTRGNTQQKIVEAIISKVMQNGIGAGEALNILNILGDNFRSNFSTDNIKAGVRVLTDFNVANIRQVPLVDYETNTFYMTTDTINNVSYVIPSAGVNNYTKIQEYVAEMFSSNPTAREHARIAIYNASGQYGVAGAERSRLQDDGYNVVSIGDTTTGSCASKYCVYVVGQDFPATTTALAERYGISVKSGDELPSDIDPGETDIIILLGFSGDAA